MQLLCGAQLCFADGAVTGVKAKQFEAIKSAAVNNDAVAQRNLGYLYRDGIGVDKNNEEAFRWFYKAAEQGDAIAQNNVGVFYENGIGIEIDVNKALIWYEKSAEQGNDYGQVNLGKFYLYGIAVEKNFEKAVSFFEYSASKNNAEAEFYLGRCYANGEGVSIDFVKANILYSKSASKGFAKAKNNLGVSYLNGNGVDKNLKLAIDWFRKAAEAGDARGQVNLGYMYATGQGIGIDYIEAAKWFKKAEAQGLADATTSLKNIQQDLKRQKDANADEVKGYKRIEFSDFDIDAGRKLRYGTKVAIAGAYKVRGQLEMLTENLITLQNDNGVDIVLITKDAVRDTRQALIKMRNGVCGMGGYCKITVLGYVSQCDITWVGRAYRKTACLVLDEIRTGD